MENLDLAVLLESSTRDRVPELLVHCLPGSTELTPDRIGYLKAAAFFVELARLEAPSAASFAVSVKGRSCVVASDERARHRAQVARLSALLTQELENDYA